MNRAKRRSIESRILQAGFPGRCPGCKRTLGPGDSVVGGVDWRGKAIQAGTCCQHLVVEPLTRHGFNGFAGRVMPGDPTPRGEDHPRECLPGTDVPDVGRIPVVGADAIDMDGSEIGSIQDDLSFFARHPHRVHRLRIAHADEAGVWAADGKAMMPDMVHWTLVRHSPPDGRDRIPVQMPVGEHVPDGERLAEMLFLAIKDARAGQRGPISREDWRTMLEDGGFGYLNDEEDG